MTTAANCSQFESAPAATCVAAELLKVASLVVGERPVGESNKEGRPKLSRQEIIHRFKELLEEREGELIAVKELASTAGVSERTLRNTFTEYFGVGPNCESGFGSGEIRRRRKN